MTKALHLKTKGQGLHEITDEIIRLVVSTEVREGLCTLFIQPQARIPCITEPPTFVSRSSRPEWE